jgi:hypothetical protein
LGQEDPATRMTSSPTAQGVIGRGDDAIGGVTVYKQGASRALLLRAIRGRQLADGDVMAVDLR